MTGKEASMASGGRNFWRGHYGKEPFDLRLTVLRMLHGIPVIAAAALLGSLVFGGGYYVKNVLLRSRHLYAATSVYRVEYNVGSEEELQTSYINAASWNTYMHSEMFLEMVRTHLTDGATLAGQELAESLEAFMRSDLRLLEATVTMEDGGRAEELLRAVDAAMEEDFSLKEISSIAVINPGRAGEVIPDVRVGRAVILGALLSCFFAVIALLLKETGDDSIWLPGTIWKRYGVKTAGTLESRELEENLRYFFREEGLGEAAVEGAAQDREACGGASPEGEACGGVALGGKAGKAVAPGGEAQAKGHGIAVCTVQGGMEPGAVIAKLREKCPDTVDASWFGVGSPLAGPGNGNALRQAGGILLAVKAGRHAGKKLEYVLEYLEQQDCRVTAAILWEADEKLIKRYYFGRAPKSAKPGRQ